MQRGASIQHTLKFLLVGNGNVGKTSIVRRLCRGDFSDETETTIGVEFMTKVIDINKCSIKLQIWDTAGQEKYRSVGKAYYRNAIGILLVFSLTDHKSFETLETWMDDVRQYCHPKAEMILVGNKCDLVDQRRVSATEIQSFCDCRRVPYIESSAKLGTNINESFFQVTKRIYDGILQGDITLGNNAHLPEQVKKNKDNEENEKTCSC